MVLHNKIAYITDIESQRAKQHAVTSKISEHADELPQVFP